MPAGVICREARVCRKVRARIEWTMGTCRRSTVTRAARWAGCGRSRPVAWSMHTAAGPVRRICRQRPSGRRSYRRSRTRCCGTPSAMRWGKAPVPCGFPLLVARSARRPVRLPKTGGDAFLEPYAGQGVACLQLVRRSSSARAWAADSPWRRSHKLSRSSLSKKNFGSLITACLTNRNGTGDWNGRNLEL
jgi:hypothetical protein